MLMLNLSHNTLIVDPKSSYSNEAKEIRRDKMAKFGRQRREDKTFRDGLSLNQRSRKVFGRSLSSDQSNKSARSGRSHSNSLSS